MALAGARGPCSAGCGSAGRSGYTLRAWQHWEAARIVPLSDIVLDSLEEVSIHWHPLGATSPNICASARVVHGQLPDADIIAAGEANRGRPDEQRLLDTADPAGALTAVLAETQAWHDLGPARRALLDRIDPGTGA